MISNTASGGNQFNPTDGRENKDARHQKLPAATSPRAPFVRLCCCDLRLFAGEQFAGWPQEDYIESTETLVLSRSFSHTLAWHASLSLRADPRPPSPLPLPFFS